ncbi:DUF4386 domain-containing protein [Chengkuizengella axinellae]|uniref:DUF4386 domain-containing protein n=1 Tax=Chengkuizengella axinellae TaxID=3064388 RepID=A0ABT9J558_9BACL|nr:DUF4386 domain-containing protein [Chengkuizengella sp. 2205SS18-9]MDP5276760.1 DUF4386 domain-containing protein [Chengkuizengella sp. 2205SS18-9]
MSLNRKTAIIFGILLILGLISGILSSVPALERSDYLNQLSSIKMQVLMATFFQFVMATVYVYIAILLYPNIKKYNERLALGYFGFRIIGAAFLFVGIVSLLLLLFISERFIIEGQPNPSYFQTIGELLRVYRDGMNHLGVILPWNLGGLILYFSFYRMNLIPKWLSIWGFIGSIFVLIATLLLMFDFINIITPIYFIMMAPTAIFELILAIYLLIKGFNPIVDDSNYK